MANFCFAGHTVAPMGAGRAGAIDRLLNAGQRVVVFGLASISFGGLTYIGLCFVDMQRRKYAIKQAQSIEEKQEEVREEA